jgi:hypothetical protein
METKGRESSGQSVLERLGQLEVREGISHDKMAVFPIFEREAKAAPLEYRTLGEAIAEGWAEVTEQPSATVPELVLWNRGKLMVLVLDGEEIVGGRQNRIANASFLVGAGTKVSLPVSCVEHGRWHESSPRFASGEVSYNSLKREKHHQVVASLRATGRPVADQGAVWDSVAERQERHQVESPTGAMRDIYRDSEQALADYERAFAYVPEAIGLVVGLGDEVVGADLFDQPRTARTLWPKLVRSYALDAFEGKRKASVDRDRAGQLLTRARDSRSEVFPSLALGEDVRLEGAGVVGSALVYRDTPVHASLFGGRASDASQRGQIARASTRRGLRL